jgi:hypothetical protein
MRILKKLTGVVAGAASLMLLGAPAVGAAPGAGGGYTLFGEADLVSPGNGSPTAAQTVSDSDPGYGGVDFTLPDDMTFGNLQNLSTDYNVTDDGCAAGSPRYSIGLDTNNDGTDDGNVFVYLGQPPNYTCTPGWQSSGNLVEPTDLIDTSQVGGTFYEPVATAQARLGDATITSIQLVTDAGYAFPDGEQTVLFDNSAINGMVETYESANSCKNGGYKLFTNNPGPFKNQGQCVSYFATRK